MFVTVSTHNDIWVSSVFRDRGDADEYLNRIQRQGGELNVQVHDVHVESYPLFILEDSHYANSVLKREFTFMSRGEMSAFMDALKDPGGLRVYRVDTDWQPPFDQAGMDYMGGLESCEVGDAPEHFWR